MLVWELHIRNSMSVLEYTGIPRGLVFPSMLNEARVDPNYFTIILQFSVGTLETVSEFVCIGRNRCATYTNHAIKIRSAIAKLAGLTRSSS